MIKICGNSNFNDFCHFPKKKKKKKSHVIENVHQAPEYTYIYIYIYNVAIEFCLENSLLHQQAPT